MGTIVETKRLTLRKSSLEDLPAVHDIAMDFDVVRNTGTWPWPADREFTSARCQPMPEEHGLGGVIVQEKTVIGMASVVLDGELGYMLGKAHWGQGYATEICQALIGVAFASGRWGQIHACVFDDNPGSGRVLEKLGFAEGAACKSLCTARGQELPTRNFILDAPKA